MLNVPPTMMGQDQDALKYIMLKLVPKHWCYFTSVPEEGLPKTRIYFYSVYRKPLFFLIYLSCFVFVCVHYVNGQLHDL